jgi:Uri superfamily endonuclease
MSLKTWEKAAQTNPALCTYRLFIQVSRPISLEVGRLGRHSFPAGRYVYTGSAKRNLAARVRRHISNEKKLRWHIDYLLASRFAKIVHVDVSEHPECEWNHAVEGRVIVKGFGASDCHACCGSHLKLIATKDET